MIWGGIWSDGRTAAVIINGTLDAEKYRTEIVIPQMIPTAQMHGLIVQQGNARPHVV